MPKILLILCLSVVAFVAVPSAQAAVIPGQTIAGPTPDINPLTGMDIDLGPDGTGAVAFVAEGQVAVARRVGGVWNPPRQPPASAGLQRSPQVEAASDGRVVVAYKRGSDLLASVAPGAGQPFSEPIPIQTAVQAYDFEMNDAGVGYFVFSGGGDVSAKRLVGTTATAVGGGALDKVPANTAGNTDQAIAVDAAGNAVAAWDEQRGDITDIYGAPHQQDHARRGDGGDRSQPGGRPLERRRERRCRERRRRQRLGRFREQFTYINGRNRPLVRRLAGNAFGPPLLIDSGPTPPADMTDAEFTRLAVTPAGDHAIASGAEE